MNDVSPHNASEFLGLVGAT